MEEQRDQTTSPLPKLKADFRNQLTLGSLHRTRSSKTSVAKSSRSELQSTGFETVALYCYETVALPSDLSELSSMPTTMPTGTSVPA
jgi:hypothetical protein